MLQNGNMAGNVKGVLAVVPRRIPRKKECHPEGALATEGSGVPRPHASRTCHREKRFFKSRSSFQNDSYYSFQNDLCCRMTSTPDRGSHRAN